MTTFQDVKTWKGMTAVDADGDKIDTIVKDAPKVEPRGDLTPDEERRLWEHYGRSDYGEWQGDDKTSDLDEELEPAATGGTGSGSDGPTIVGVRLRRAVVVTVPEPDDR